MKTSSSKITKASKRTSPTGICDPPFIQIAADSSIVQEEHGCRGSCFSLKPSESADIGKVIAGLSTLEVSVKTNMMPSSPTETMTIPAAPKMSPIELPHILDDSCMPVDEEAPWMNFDYWHTLADGEF